MSCLLKNIYKFINFNWRLITLQYCIGVAIHQRESTTGVHIMNPFPTSLSTPIPLGHPSAPAPSILHPASNLDWRFVSYMKGTLLHCWWECKLVQPLWRTAWRFLEKLEIELRTFSVCYWGSFQIRLMVVLLFLTFSPYYSPYL